MDPVARKSVVKQGRAHFLLLIWIVLKVEIKRKDFSPIVMITYLVSQNSGLSRGEREGGVIS